MFDQSMAHKSFRHGVAQIYEFLGTWWSDHGRPGLLNDRESLCSEYGVVIAIRKNGISEVHIGSGNEF